MPHKGEGANDDEGPNAALRHNGMVIVAGACALVQELQVSVLRVTLNSSARQVHCRSVLSSPFPVCLCGAPVVCSATWKYPKKPACYYLRFEMMSFVE